MNKQETQAEALARARGNTNVGNYGAIFAGFLAQGIPEGDIKPRENVFTYQAWRALGRQVRRGEHGVRVLAMIEREREQTTSDGLKNTETVRFRVGATVFHVSQTDPA